ncbi:Hypothetical protein POVR1_LOCUS170 [uncultured virus]|nr:Hypothetical protein POVR1_LOCUS170 [uncultured virus]
MARLPWLIPERELSWRASLCHVQYSSLLGYINYLPSPMQIYVKLSQVPAVKQHMAWRLSIDPSKNAPYRRHRTDQEWMNYEIGQWLFHYDEILRLLQAHYGVPEEPWVDYPKFREWMMNGMADQFFQQLEEMLNDDVEDPFEYEIDFRWQLAFALISNDIDPGGSSGFCVINNMSNTTITIIQAPPIIKNIPPIAEEQSIRKLSF